MAQLKAVQAGTRLQYVAQRGQSMTAYRILRGLPPVNEVLGSLRNPDSVQSLGGGGEGGRGGGQWWWMQAEAGTPAPVCSRRS